MNSYLANAAVCTLLLGTGCNEDIFSPPYQPVLPTAWASTVTNPFFPLVAGRRFEYRGQTEDGLETIVVEVLSQTRAVNGVQATAVRDRVYINGQLREDTEDWFAQDAQGNVWYLGEDSKDIRNGQVVSTEGSWIWGSNGALPGVIMWADPGAHLNQDYRQEYFRGEAEDWGRVIGVNETVTVPHGTFSNCVRTRDWNGLEPDEVENKFYCRNIGLVLETAGQERVELLTVTNN